MRLGIHRQHPAKTFSSRGDLMRGNALWTAFAAALLASSVTAPLSAKRIGDDEWEAVGRDSNGDDWSVQIVSAVAFKGGDRQLQRIFNSDGVWLKTVPSSGKTFRKVYWQVRCDPKGFFVRSRVTFSKSGAQLARWDNPKSLAPIDRPIWSLAAPGTIESKVIGKLCSD